MNAFEYILFYHYLMSDEGLAMALCVSPEFFPESFFGSSLKICFTCAQDFIKKYNTGPTREQLKELIHISEYAEDITDDEIDGIYVNKDSLKSYSEEWLHDTVGGWVEWETLGKALRDAMILFKLSAPNVTPENVKETTEKVISSFNQHCTANFNSVNEGVDFWDSAAHNVAKVPHFSTGYHFIDETMEGGYFSGSLTVFVGAPKIGKSMWLQNLCAESVKRGNDCAYISLELSPGLILTRMTPMICGIAGSAYKKLIGDEAGVKQILTNYRKNSLIKPGELAIQQFPTSTASVPDLERYLLSEETKRSTQDHPFKFKAVYVDYINIMRNYRNPNSENTYMKIKQIAEDLRAIAIKNKWAIVSATQTKTGQFETNDMSVKDVSESSGLNATVDMMYGIIATPEMVATGKYMLKCLYDRIAPFANYKKGYNFESTYLRITEDANPASRDADVIVPSYMQHNNRANTQNSTSGVELINANAASKQLTPNTSFELNRPITANPETPMVDSPINITAMGLFEK